MILQEICTFPTQKNVEQDPRTKTISTMSVPSKGKVAPYFGIW